MKKERLGFCFRCEHRARFLESGRHPRSECGDPHVNVHGCYMYRPVKPVVVAKADKNDSRPQFGPWMISSRSRFVRVADEMELAVKETKDGNILYWSVQES